MRMYQVFTRQGPFTFEADELGYCDDFQDVSKDEPLLFYIKNRLVAVFKEWDLVLDVTGKSTKKGEKA